MAIAVDHVAEAQSPCVQLNSRAQSAKPGLILGAPSPQYRGLVRAMPGGQWCKVTDPCPRSRGEYKHFSMGRAGVDQTMTKWLDLKILEAQSHLLLCKFSDRSITHRLAFASFSCSHATSPSSPGCLRRQFGTNDVHQIYSEHFMIYGIQSSSIPKTFPSL